MRSTKMTESELRLLREKASLEKACLFLDLKTLQLYGLMTEEDLLTQIALLKDESVKQLLIDNGAMV